MSELAVISLARIRPNLNQARRTFHRIDELARSIAQYGLLQNLVVRPLAEAGYYEVVAGERRYRALTLLAKVRMQAMVSSRFRRPLGKAQLAQAPSVVHLRREGRNRAGVPPKPLSGNIRGTPPKTCLLTTRKNQKTAVRRRGLEPPWELPR
jgi:ParB-like nuclease domain